MDIGILTHDSNFNTDTFTRIVFTKALMPFSHCRWYVLRLEVLLGGGTASQVTHCVQVVHTTGSVICGYRCLLKCQSSNYHPRFVCDLVSPWRNIRQLTLCRRITPKDDQVITLCTLWITPSVTVVRNSYICAESFMHAHSTKIGGRNFKLLKTTMGLVG